MMFRHFVKTHIVHSLTLMIEIARETVALCIVLKTYIALFTNYPITADLCIVMDEDQ